MFEDEEFPDMFRTIPTPLFSANMSDDDSYRWSVQLKGHDFDLEVIEVLLKPEGYVIQKNNNKEWYISGPSLEDASDTGEARRRAEELVRNVNAVLLARGNEFQPVTVGSKVLTEGGENFVAHIEVSEALQFRSKAVVVNSGDKNESRPPQLERERAWLVARQRDPQVKAVLDLLINDPDNKYYRAFERIRDDLTDSERLCQLAGWSETQYREVKGALNVPRHEEPDYKPSMSLSEAIQHTEELIRIWLDEKSRNIP